MKTVTTLIVVVLLGWFITVTFYGPELHKALNGTSQVNHYKRSR